MTDPDPLADLLGESPAFAEVKLRARQMLARGGSGGRLPPVLIQGETGSGKGVLARALHNARLGVAGPFIAVNCGAIPETLGESEFFGFARGAHSEARHAKAGLFQAADRGSIFLDEVGLLSRGHQARLLKVIEDRQVIPVGATKPVPVDVWIISATNADLWTDVQDQKFRRDLYERLAVMTFSLPALRERRSDIVRLAESFLARSCAEYGLRPKKLAADAQQRLLDHSWPGNIRELGNVIERAAVLVEGDVITAARLELTTPAPVAVAPPAPPPSARRVDRRMRILAALERQEGNITRTAADLGVSRKTLREWMRQEGLYPPRGARDLRDSSLSARDDPAHTAGDGSDDGVDGLMAALPMGEAAATTRSALSAASQITSASTSDIHWERRWIALLRVSLAAESDEGALDTTRPLEAIADKVQTFGGRVTELGRTGLEAAFGLDPLEDAVQRAAYAALAIQRARARDGSSLTPIARIALHADSYLVGHMGTSTQIDQDAKRAASALLEALIDAAAPDDIVVSHAMPSLLRRHFEFGGPMAAGATGTAYRLLGRADPPAVFDGLISSFVGRESEMELLENRWALARQGLGQIVGIVGDPGVGKSRLVWEFLQREVQTPSLVLQASSAALGRPTPYLAIIELLRKYFELKGGEEDAAVREQVTRYVAELDPALAPSLPAFLSLLDVPTEDPVWDGLEPSRRRRHTLDAVKRLMLCESARRPLLLVFEDAHWADVQTRELLDEIADSMAVARVLMLVTYRPEHQHGWGGRSVYSQLRVEPLRGTSAVRLVDELLGIDPSLAALRLRLIQWTDGNPFFIEEVVRTLAETGALRGKRGAYGLAHAVDTIVVPGAVEEVLAARIARLGHGPAGLLRAAAVIGRQVPYAVLEGVSRQRPETIEAHLRALQNREFLYQTNEGGEREYLFRHALTQEVAYASLTDEERRSLHARAMESMALVYDAREGEKINELAHHAFEGHVWDRAAGYLRRAGRRAFARSANREAVECLTRALTALSHLPQSRAQQEEAIDLRLDLRSALWPLGEVGGVGKTLREAGELARALDDPRRQGLVAAARCHYCWVTSRHADAVSAGAEALSFARAVGDRALENEATLYMGIVHGAMGNYGEAVQFIHASLDAYEASGGSLSGRDWVLGLSTARTYIARYLAELGELGRAADHMRAGMKATEVGVSSYFLATCYFGVGSVELRRGDFLAAIPFFERALDLCRTHRLGNWLPAIGSSLGYAYANAGRPAEGVAVLEQAIADADRMHLSASYALWLTYLGLAYLRVGRFEEARRSGQAALDRARRQDERGHAAWALYLLAAVAAAAEPPVAEEIERAFHEAIDSAHALGMRPLLAHCHAGLADALTRLGQLARASDARASAQSIREDIGMIAPAGGATAPS